MFCLNNPKWLGKYLSAALDCERAWFFAKQKERAILSLRGASEASDVAIP